MALALSLLCCKVMWTALPFTLLDRAMASGTTDPEASRSDDQNLGRTCTIYHHGSFTMQLEHAETNVVLAAGIPKSNRALGHSLSLFPPTKKDRRDFVLVIHSVVMCSAFIVVFPSGVLVMRFAIRVLVHVAVQGTGFCARLHGSCCWHCRQCQVPLKRALIFYTPDHRCLGRGGACCAT